MVIGFNLHSFLFYFILIMYSKWLLGIKFFILRNKPCPQGVSMLSEQTDL